MLSGLKRSQRIFLATIVGLLGIFMGYDAWVDANHGENWFHISADVIVIFVLSGTVAGICWQCLRPSSQGKKGEDGYSEFFNLEAARWRLSDAEKRVTAGILNGQSFFEIARDLNKSERTVRQQAIAVYKKAGFRNRSELTGHFIKLNVKISPSASNDG